MKGAPRSKEFDDVYFSAEDGLAETRHVFLDGNNLPQAWAGREKFTIAETGFGTGLNFLSAWRLFAETAEDGQNLEFISVEKFPLSRAEIGAYLEPVLNDGWERYLDAFLKIYPEDIQGAHVLMVTESVTLKLIFGDVNAVLPSMQESVDCWFLDGFKPSSNPEMWTESVFENMARLSARDATFATFTAAGFVRRGLQVAGFEVRKVKGFGSKRDMLCGRKP